MGVIAVVLAIGAPAAWRALGQPEPVSGSDTGRGTPTTTPSARSGRHIRRSDPCDGNVASDLRCVHHPGRSCGHDRVGGHRRGHLDTDAGRVRVFGIDTPEVGKPFADEATQAVERLAVVGETVYLWRSPGSDDRDIYGRLVRTVYLPDGTDLGESLVRAGLALAFVRYSDRYVVTEQAARSEGLGLWGSSARPLLGTPSAAPDPSTGADPWNRPGPDLDCPDIGHPVTITGTDYHRLDLDGDGIGCDSYG